MSDLESPTTPGETGAYMTLDKKIAEICMEEGCTEQSLYLPDTFKNCGPFWLALWRVYDTSTWHDWQCDALTQHSREELAEPLREAMLRAMDCRHNLTPEEHETALLTIGKLVYERVTAYLGSKT